MSRAAIYTRVSTDEQSASAAADRHAAELALGTATEVSR